MGYLAFVISLLRIYRPIACLAFNNPVADVCARTFHRIYEYDQLAPQGTRGHPSTLGFPNLFRRLEGPNDVMQNSLK